VRDHQHLHQAIVEFCKLELTFRTAPLTAEVPAKKRDKRSHKRAHSFGTVHYVESSSAGNALVRVLQSNRYFRLAEISLQLQSFQVTGSHPSNELLISSTQSADSMAPQPLVQIDWVRTQLNPTRATHTTNIKTHH
jgi:hypothetical protein